MRGNHGFLMIVEDGHAPSRDPNRLFPRRGWETCLAITAGQALTFLDRGLEPDCIVLPKRRPGEGGAAGLREVHEARLPIRVVICTGPTTVEKIEDFRALKPDLMLIRPIDADAVGKAASKICDR